MKKDRNQKRLQLLEEGLTPREWAVMLAARIRRFDTFVEYIECIDDGGLEVIAHRRLVDGARRRGKRDGKTEGVIAKEANEAQFEFLVLKHLIVQTQQFTRDQICPWHLMLSLAMERLKGLGLEVVCESMVVIAKADTHFGLENVNDTDGLGAWVRAAQRAKKERIDSNETRFLERLETEINSLRNLVSEIQCYRSAIQLLETDLLEGHKILARDIANGLDRVSEHAKGAVEYSRGILSGCRKLRNRDNGIDGRLDCEKVSVQLFEWDDAAPSANEVNGLKDSWITKAQRQARLAWETSGSKQITYSRAKQILMPREV